MCGLLLIEIKVSKLFTVNTMVICLITGCSKYSGHDKDVSFYPVPKIFWRTTGLKALADDAGTGLLLWSGIQTSQTILENDRMCSRHFITGKPTESEDQLHSDWPPTLNLGHGHPKIDEVHAKETLERYQRAVSRAARSEQMETTETWLSFSTQCYHEQKETLQGEDTTDAVSVGVQTDLTTLDNLLFSNELHKSKQKITELEDQLNTY